MRISDLSSDVCSSDLLQALPVLAPATDFESETLTALEAGYRGQPADSTNLSVSVSYNIHGDLRTTEFAPGGMLPIRHAHSLKGHHHLHAARATSHDTSRLLTTPGPSTGDEDLQAEQGHCASSEAERRGKGG